MIRSLSVLCVLSLLAAPLVAEQKAAPKKEKTMMKTQSGLEYEDLVAGTGESPKTGQTCVMHYTGWLYEAGQKGKKFDSSLDRGKPFEFPIGTGRVIKGWDEGVASMKVGGKRTLVIPPNATLLFDVELLGVK